MGLDFVVFAVCGCLDVLAFRGVDSILHGAGGEELATELKKALGFAQVDSRFLEARSSCVGSAGGIFVTEFVEDLVMWGALAVVPGAAAQETACLDLGGFQGCLRH